MIGQPALRTIVVATDFSDNADLALAWAEQLARRHGAGLVLVHAFTPEALVAPELVPLLQDYYHELRTAAEARLAHAAEKAGLGGVTVVWELGFGPPFEVVIATARARQADLIVAGTRGRTGWKKIVLGSTAARLVRKAHCPMLTIHPTDAGAPRLVRTVLVPTDFSQDAELAVQAAARILGAAGADRRLVLLHVHDVPFEATCLPAAVLMDAIAAVDAAAKRRIDELAAAMRSTGIPLETVTCPGYAPQVILDQARSIGADLIAMGTHGRAGMDRLFLGSTAEAVLAAAACPVLTLRREPAA